MASVPGQRIVVTELERRARVEPNKVIACYPQSNTLDKETFRDVTFADFAKAVDRVCAYLEPIIGRSTTFDTQAYFGPPDMRYHLFILACMILGHKTLISAPRNSIPMHLHLFKESECSSAFSSKEIDVAALLGYAQDVKIRPFPDLDDLLWGADEPQHYQYTRSYAESKMDPYIVLHTSGSTGMPKPVVHRHGWLGAMDWQTHHKGEDGRKSTVAMIGANARRYMAFPPWHVAGSELISLSAQIFGDCVFVWGPTDRLPTPDDVIRCCDYGHADEIGLPAQLYQDLVKHKDGMGLLSRVAVAFYGGGPMDKDLGDKISTVTLVQNVYGTSECGWVGLQLTPDREAWDHIVLPSSNSGMEFREQTPGIYELVLIRAADSWEQYSIWFTFPEKKEYPTKDLWHKHPSKPHHWFYEGRVDDLIVYKNVSKFNPLAFEEHLRSNPLIRYPIVVGTNRQQSGILIELEPAAKALPTEDVLAQIWLTIESANAVAPKHAIVQKTHVIFETPEKPFQRTAKGTVQKLPTQKLYKEEIDEMYLKYGDNKMSGTIAPTLPGIRVGGTVNGSLK